MSESPVEALNKLRAGREGAKKPGEVTFVLDGVPTPVQVVWDALDTRDIEALLSASPEEVEKLGITAEQHKKFKDEHEVVRKNLAVAASLTKKGENSERMIKRIEEVYPVFLKTIKDLGIEIKPRVRTPKSRPTAAPTEANPAPVETPAPPTAAEQEIVEALKGGPERTQPTFKRLDSVPARIIDVESSARVHTSETPNSLGELNTLDFTSIGLDQVLTEPKGPEKLKARINAGMKAALHGLPKRKSIAKEVPEYRPAEQMRHWLAFTVIEMNASTGRVNVDDFKEYSELLSALDTAVRNLPEETRERLSEKKEKPTTAVPEQKLSPEANENALRDSLLKRLDECRNRADGILSKRGRSQPKDRAMFESMVIQVRESIWRNYSRDNNDIIARGDVKSLEEFLDKWSAEATVEAPVASPESPEGLRNRLDASLARVRAATKDVHHGNPAAVVNIKGTQEFFAGYNSAKALLEAHKNGQLNGATEETTALPAVTASVVELERMSFEIANTVTAREVSAQITATKPPEAVAAAPTIKIVVENADSAAAPKSSERAPELGALKEKRDAYMTAKAAYEKAIDAHYGRYRSNTGPFAERLGRGMRKFFGMGPKHTSLEPLYLAMNDARVDYSKTRFGMMDARINRMYNKNGSQNAEVVTAWHDKLKRREITRTIQRSSEGFVERQYKALSPAQQSAVDAALGRSEGAIRKDERRMTYAQFAVGTLSGALMVWKTKAAFASGGLSLVAGALGVVTGNTVGNVVEWWKNRRIEKLKDNFNHLSEERGKTVDFDTTASYDATLRNSTRKIIATEESRNTQVKAARIAGAAAGVFAAGGVAGGIAGELDLGGKNIDDRVLPSLESTPKGNFEIPVPGPESQPIPAPMPDGGDGALEKAGMYQMVRNDNPWDLVEEKHFSEKFDGMTKTERDVVIDSAMDRLRADEAYRDKIFPGYNGTSFTDMQIGQNVNLTAYEKLIDEELAIHGHGAETLSPLSSPELLPDDESIAGEPAEGSEEDESITHIGEQQASIQPTAEVSQGAPQPEAGVSTVEITRERMNLYTTLGDQEKGGGIFASLFGGGRTTAHEFLANQSLADISKLSAQRPEYIEMIASQNSVDATALQNWANYMKQLAPDIANRSSDMTFSSYVDVVSEELAKHSKAAS